MRFFGWALCQSQSSGLRTVRPESVGDSKDLIKSNTILYIPEVCNHIQTCFDDSDEMEEGVELP